MPCPLIPWPSSDFSSKLIHSTPDAIPCKDPEQLRRHGFPGLWLLGSQDYPRPFRKKKKEKKRRLHQMGWDFKTSRLTLEGSWKAGHSSTHPLFSQTNAICLFTMHSGSLLCGWPSILKRCQKHLGPSFPFSSLLQSYLIWLRGKWILWWTGLQFLKAVHQGTRSLVNSGCF